MSILLVNVGLPSQVIPNGQIITTSIFKAPVGGRVKIGKIGLDYDKQSDLKFHGGIGKAVYSYPFEHYDYWKKCYPQIDMSWVCSEETSLRKD